MFTDDDLDRTLTHWRKESQLTRYTIPSVGYNAGERAGNGKHHVKDARRNLANDLEGEAARRLEAMGFHTVKQSHSARFDLAAIDQDAGAALRVEVKASTWDEHKQRYQFNLHDNQADVFLFGCLDGALHWFVVPLDLVEGKRSVEIRPHNPADHIGKLTAFFEAWEILPDLAKAARNPFQMDLGIAGQMSR